MARQPSDTRQPESIITRRILVGTSGFGYTEWRGKFYPQALSPKKFLSYYAQHFSTTEINNTFYRIPTPALVRNWHEEVPADFQFTLKVSQEITHRKKLKNVDPEMKRFLEGAVALEAKLATLLVQLPPFFRKDMETLEDFVSKFSSQALLSFEFRHASWFCDDVYELLQRHQCALAVVEKEEGEGAESPRQVTGPFIYMRLRKGEYSDVELLDWAQWIRRQTVNVFCYLKHDNEAPLLAKRLLEALGKL
ncbi:MAG: DUF72 domain-containing protein [Acidobacteria bacterium]|nr:DUF72 domain-containing protein [Acidobacteriota bacterium]MCI0623680.1 DUF72 domain-containing protein [Acidobacteriota bacterium]MCI0722262.1 DUF72 domain-containing protein [Acidobacteriota bacterium]